MTDIKAVLTKEEIESAQTAAYRALVANGYNGGMGGAQWDEAHARAIEQAVLAKQSVEVGEVMAFLDPDGDEDCNVISASWKDKLSKTGLSDGYEEKHALKHSVALVRATPPAPSSDAKDAERYKSVLLAILKEPNETLSEGRKIAQMVKIAQEHFAATDKKEGV